MAARSTEGTVDPRYDPVFQRGYGPGHGSAPRDSLADVVAFLSPDQAPPHGSATPAQSEDRPEPVGAGTAERPPAELSRRWKAVLWTLSVALMLGGALLYLFTWRVQFGVSWSGDGDTMTPANGMTMDQLILSYFGLAVAPWVSVLGAATGIGTLFLSAIRGRRTE